jgi:ATP-dependent Clp protease ATP-binding subunit ClpA
VFERFTERARQVIVLAQEEARILKRNYIGTEHILLGLLREEEGLAARALESLDITLDHTRAQVVKIVGQGNEVPAPALPFTPRAKKVLELGLQEALGDDHLATHHLLLGLLREGDGVANRILVDSGAEPERLRTLVAAGLDGAPEEQPAPPKTLTRISRGTGPIASPSPGGPSPAEICSFCGERGRQLFAGFPPKEEEASICDRCLDVFYATLSEQREDLK